MTESERQQLIEKLAEICVAAECGLKLTQDDARVCHDVIAALASCPTVEQREQALELAKHSMVDYNVHAARDDAESRRLLGLAPTGE